MKRRAITDKDLQDFLKILNRWETATDGQLSWKNYITQIASITGYSYERTALYKSKGGEIFREFQQTKERLKNSNASKGRGGTMSRQNLLKAYSTQSLEIDRLRNENVHLLRLHVKYLKIMFDHDIFPDENQI